MSISDSVAWLRKQLRLCVADVNEILIHTAGGSAGHMTSGAFKDPLYTKPIRNTPAIQQECVCVCVCTDDFTLKQNNISEENRQVVQSKHCLLLDKTPDWFQFECVLSAWQIRCIQRKHNTLL